MRVDLQANSGMPCAGVLCQNTAGSHRGRCHGAVCGPGRRGGRRPVQGVRRAAPQGSAHAAHCSLSRFICSGVLHCCVVLHQHMAVEYCCRNKAAGLCREQRFSMPCLQGCGLATFADHQSAADAILALDGVYMWPNFHDPMVMLTACQQHSAAVRMMRSADECRCSTTTHQTCHS